MPQKEPQNILKILKILPFKSSNIVSPMVLVNIDIKHFAHNIKYLDKDSFYSHQGAGSILAPPTLGGFPDIYQCELSVKTLSLLLLLLHLLLLQLIMLLLPKLFI